MFYNLSENVYLVKGACKSCIYDFNGAKLYSVNDKLAHLIDEVNSGKVFSDCPTGYDKETVSALHELEQCHILTQNDIHIYRDISELKKDNAPVTMAWIEVTTKCNLRCIHCYNESDYHCDAFMAQEDYRLVIDNLAQMHVKKLQLIGGEPFIDRRALRYMLDYTVGKFSGIEVFTNGTLITEDWYRYLSENNIRVALSVYSYDSKIHDFVTKSKGSWAKTNDTIRRLKEHGIKYRVCNILMKDVDLGEKNTDNYELSNERDIVRMTGRAGLSLLTDELIKKRLITKESFSAPIKRSFSSRLVSGHNCFDSRLYIAANLDVFPCVMERRIKHCNIKQSGKIALDKSIQTLNKDRIQGCDCCEYRYACFDCRPNSLTENVYEKPWYCTYEPRTATWRDADTFIAELRKGRA